MTALSTTPRWVDAVLARRGIGLLARLALSSAYLLGGLSKLWDFPVAVAEQVHFGMTAPAAMAMLTIAIELIGPALILSGRMVWLGAGMLGVFTALAAIVANGFWAMAPGPERFAATNAFFEHLGLVGGFVMVAMAARKD